jgi:hypothetical protein
MDEIWIKVFVVNKVFTDKEFQDLDFESENAEQQLNRIIQKYITDGKIKSSNILPALTDDNTLNLQRKQIFLRDALLNMEETLFTTEEQDYDADLGTESEKRDQIHRRRGEVFAAAQTIEGRLRNYKTKELKDGGIYLGFGSKGCDAKDTQIFCTAKSGEGSFTTGYAGVKEALGANNVVLHFEKKIQTSQYAKWIKEEPICDIEDENMQLQLSQLQPGNEVCVAVALEFMNNNPSYLDNPTVIEKIRSVFDKKNIENSQTNVEFWKNPPDLQKIYSEAIKNNNTTAALFTAECSSRLEPANNSSASLSLEKIVKDDKTLLDFSLDTLIKKNGPYTYSTLLILSLLTSKI